MSARRPFRFATRAKLLLRGLRYARLWPYISVDGWLTVDEAIALYELARGLPHERPVAVEIGCWQGKSSICLARGLQGKFEPKLVCIDPFDASGDTASVGTYQGKAGALGGTLRAQFERNVAAAGVREVVAVAPGFSHERAPEFQTPIDLLFVDGDHSEAAVRRDVADWAPKVRPGGYLVLHDVVHPVHRGPAAVVQEQLAGDPHWLDQRYVDSMFIARRAAG
ncbi:MAG: class I SAM-dependent methyltransferase [Planctomycetes bacterium]|nr:class I SAM-dependent methyltransferase [Planctomycetota bacterium]